MKQRLTLYIGIALALTILSSGLITRAAQAAPQVPSTGHRHHTVTVMTQNMFGESTDSSTPQAFTMRRRRAR